MSRVTTSIDDWQRAHRECHRCVDAGYLVSARPVFSGRGDERILLVGQAPGPVEEDTARPFAGRAGRELMRWLTRAGFADEADVRARVYMTSMTSCFPGRLRSGVGDRRPSAREVSLCAHWLDGDLAAVRPRLILAIGTLALSRFLPGRRLDDVVGEAWTSAGIVEGVPEVTPVILPLPHPSGQSRWTNDPARARLRDQALERLATLLRWVDE